MRWVAISVSIAADPAVHRVAAALKVRVPEAVGFLTLTFAGMAQHTPDGLVRDVPDTLLESWSGWHGKRGAFAAQFRAELCDADGTVRAWDRWNGANIRKAERAIERTRKWRDEREQQAHGTPNVMHNATRTERHNVRPGTGQDRTGHKTVTSKSGAARASRTDPEWLPRVRAHWQEHVGLTTPAELRRWITPLLSTHGEPLVRGAIEEYGAAMAGKATGVAFFAKGAVGWIAKASAADEPLVADGWLTAAGERATR